MGAACGSAGPAHRHAGALPRSPGPRDRRGTASLACGTGWFVLAPAQPFRGLGIFLQINHSQDLAYIFRQEVYGEAAVRSQVPPLIGNGCKHRQIRFTEKFFLGDTVVHKVGRLSISLVPILFGLGNYKKLIRKGKQLILHGLNEESEAVRLIKRRLLYLGPETIEEGSLLVLKVSPHSVSKEDHFDPHTTVGNFFFWQEDNHDRSHQPHVDEKKHTGLEDLLNSCACPKSCF
uniref:Uncharacterized protein n=1 Tax=Oryza glumipatula TaxID=40148 RepID=A0A0E0BRR4_9ORYZ